MNSRKKKSIHQLADAAPGVRRVLGVGLAFPGELSLDGSAIERAVVLGLRNEFGPYLMAETVIDGNAIDLQAYYNDSSLAADERLQEALRELLAGFEQDGETPVLEK